MIYRLKPLGFQLLKESLLSFTAFILFFLHHFEIEHATSNFISFERHVLFLIGPLLCLIIAFYGSNIPRSKPVVAVSVLILFFCTSHSNQNHLLENAVLSVIFLLIFFLFLYLCASFPTMLVCIFLASNIILSILYVTELTFLSFLTHFQTNSTINLGVNANYFVILIPFTAAFLIDLVKRNECFIAIVLALSLIIFSLYILSYSSSRTCLLALAGGIYFLKIKYLKIKVHSAVLKKILCCVAVVAIILIGLFLYKVNPDSVKGRILIYKVSLKMFADRPMFGFGSGSFGSYYNIYQASYFKEDSRLDTKEFMFADNTYEVFNEPIRLLVEFGLFGILLTVLVIFILLRELKGSNLQPLQKGAVASIGTIFICSLSSYPLSSSSILVLLLFFIAIVFCSQGKIKTTDSRRSLKVGMLYVLATMTVYFSFKSFEIARCERRWSKAALKSLELNFSLAKEDYEKCYPSLKNNGRFLLNYALMLENENNNKLAISVLNAAIQVYPDSECFMALGEAYEATNNLDEALKAYHMAANILPNRFLPKYKLLVLYNKMGKIGESKSMAQKVIQQPIKIPSSDIIHIKKYAKDLLKSYHNEECR